MMEVLKERARRFKPGCVFKVKSTWYFRAGKGSEAVRLGDTSKIKTSYGAWSLALPLLFKVNDIPVPPSDNGIKHRVEAIDGDWVFVFTVDGIENQAIICKQDGVSEGEARVKAMPLVRRLRDGNWESIIQEPATPCFKAAEYTNQEFSQKLVEQDGKCAICGDTPRRLNFDHDHQTGELRDLLCSHCNVALGHFRDDPERLEKAAAYLRRHGK